MTVKPRILIIEDDPPLLMMMVYLLTRAGGEVLTADNGNAGIKLAQENSLDFITLDIDLPDISGFEICRRLKQNPRSTRLPVIFISGRACEEDRRRGFELGAADYIDKPFDASIFAQKVFSHIKAAQAQV